MLGSVPPQVSARELFRLIREHWHTKNCPHYVRDVTIVGAAYVLTRFTFLGRRPYLYLLIGLQAVPSVMLLLPLFVVFASIQSAISIQSATHFQLIGTTRW